MVFLFDASPGCCHCRVGVLEAYNTDTRVSRHSCVVLDGDIPLSRRVFYAIESNSGVAHPTIIMFFCGMILSDLILVGITHSRKWVDWAALALLVAGLAVPFVLGYQEFRLLTPSPGTVEARRSSAAHYLSVLAF